VKIELPTKRVKNEERKKVQEHLKKNASATDTGSGLCRIEEGGQNKPSVKNNKRLQKFKVSNNPYR